MQLFKVNHLWRSSVVLFLAIAYGGEAKVLPETLVFTQTQFYPLHEQARGYLGRYLNQALLMDPDLPEDPNRAGIDPIGGWGTFPGQADYDITARLVRDYGFDGVAFFGMRHPRVGKAGGDCPVDGHHAVPILMWRDPIGKFGKTLNIIANIVGGKRAYTVGGKMLVLSYWTDKGSTPDEFKAKCDLVRRRFGDRFLFTASLTGLAPRGGGEERLEKLVRAWARVADGIQVGDLNVTSTIEKSERIAFTDYIRTEYKVLRKVLNEPEFAGRKLLVGAAVNGHMNAYMKGYGLLENCTKTLRDTFGLAVEAGCDVILLPEWDEYNENTCFMPTLYGSWALKRICRYFAAQAKGRPLEPIAGDDLSVPNLVVSYRKCLSPGERLTIEVLNVPDGTRSGKVTVRAEVLDENGGCLLALPAKTLDETKLEDARYELDSAALAAKARAPRVVLTYEKDGMKTVVADGLHPIDLAPANTWNHLAVKQAIRDLAKPSKAEFTMNGRRVTASFVAEEPIRYAMLCGNGCIQYVQGKPGSAVERFRESEDWAVFQVSPICVGRHEVGKEKGNKYTMSVRGIEEAEWLYVGKVTSGDTLELDDINGHATPPVYLRIPKAKLEGAVLVADYSSLGFKGTVPLDAAFEKKSYSVGRSIRSMQVTVTRFPLQARYPSVADSKEVSFSVDADADRRSMTYHVQFVTMSGKVWFSKPIVVEAKGPSADMRVWNAMTERTETLTLPSARIPSLTVDFAPSAGNVLRNSTGERHWFGLLGGPYASANLWNRGARTEGAVDKPCAVFLNTCDDSCPRRVLEPDGSWSLEFDGVDDFANLPCELWPTFGGCAIEMDVMPATDCTHRGSLWANRFGLFDLGIGKDGTLEVGFHSMGNGNMVTAKGGNLVRGKWNHVKLVSDAKRIVVWIDGAEAVTLPIVMPAANTMGVMIGGYPDKFVYRGFFKGRIRNLRVSQAVTE